MFRAHAVVPARAAGQPHFEVHRSAFAEAGADAAWGAAWILFWLVFLLAVAQPVPGGGLRGSAGGAGRTPAMGVSAQPEPGPSSRGVAPCDASGAG
jgi:hypothetical protein